MYTGVHKHDFRKTLCSCRLTVTRWVPLLEQEIPEPPGFF